MRGLHMTCIALKRPGYGLGHLGVLSEGSYVPFNIYVGPLEPPMASSPVAWPRLASAVRPKSPRHIA